MIYSETIETVYSKVENDIVYSVDEPDYRNMEAFRLTEDNLIRDTEDNEYRTLEP